MYMALNKEGLKMLTIEQAKTLCASLQGQAIATGLNGADGETLRFKIIATTEDKRVKARFGVKIVEMVEKTNLIGGAKFWIDRDTPAYLDPSTESYHSM